MFTWLTGSETRPPVLLEFRSSRTFIITTVSAAIFTDLFLYGLVVPVLPFALTARANIAPDQVQTWISILLAIFGAALLAAAPVCGHFADKSSNRRLPLLIGLLALAGSTVLLTVGSNIGVLVAGRILQGFSGAVVWVVGLALLVDTVGPAEIGEAMGYVGVSMSLSVLIAPLLGGVVFEKAGYYAVFAMAFALLGVDIVMRIALIEKKIAKKWLKDDSAETPDGDHIEAGDGVKSDKAGSDPAPGVTETKTETPTTLQPADSLSPEDQTSPDDTTPPVARESRVPVLFLLLSSRRLCTALWGCMIQATLLTSFDSILPIYVNKIFGWNSIGAGLIFLPVVLPSLIGPVIGMVSDRYGARWLATIGFVAASPVLILLRLVTYNSIRQKVLLCALLTLLGFTLNIVLTPLLAEVSYAVEATTAKRPKGFLGNKGAYAQAYGLFNMAFAAGSMIGPLLAGLVVERIGWGNTMLVLGCLSGFSAIPTYIWTGGSLFRIGRRKAENEQRVVNGEPPLP